MNGIWSVFANLEPRVPQWKFDQLVRHYSDELYYDKLLAHNEWVDRWNAFLADYKALLNLNRNIENERDQLINEFNALIADVQEYEAAYRTLETEVARKDAIIKKAAAIEPAFRALEDDVARLNQALNAAHERERQLQNELTSSKKRVAELEQERAESEAFRSSLERVLETERTRTNQHEHRAAYFKDASTVRWTEILGRDNWLMTAPADAVALTKRDRLLVNVTFLRETSRRLMDLAREYQLPDMANQKLHFTLMDNAYEYLARGGDLFKAQIQIASICAGMQPRPLPVLDSAPQIDEQRLGLKPNSGHAPASG